MVTFHSPQESHWKPDSIPDKSLPQRTSEIGVIPKAPAFTSGPTDLPRDGAIAEIPCSARKAAAPGMTPYDAL